MAVATAGSGHPYRFVVFGGANLVLARVFGEASWHHNSQRHVASQLIVRLGNSILGLGHQLPSDNPFAANLLKDAMVKQYRLAYNEA